MELDLGAIERKWREYWDNNRVYSFKYSSHSNLYSIDTPPPTVSGAMHMGHAYSYPHQDIIARYKRMRGFDVFYPFGLDDNGLPTERYTEKVNGVRGRSMPIAEFQKLCSDTSLKLEEEMLESWKAIGLSSDFQNYYRTISPEVMKISQTYFLDMYEKNMVYRNEGTSLFCPVCGTSISQIDLADREMSGNFYFIPFSGEEGEHVTIATTRPEMLWACVALFANPSDKRYAGLKGKKFAVPLSGHSVQVILDGSVDPDKGTGIEMVCTFGDQNDAMLWKKYGLPIRAVLGTDGRLNSVAGPLNGLLPQEARKEAERLLKEGGIVTDIRKTQRSVNVHERCGTPAEITVSKQWFVKCLDLKPRLIDTGRQIKWHPDHMRIRYENWVSNLRWDWCISRQRYYGIPFPVWYCQECGHIITADGSSLPVDPRITPIESCPKCRSHHIVPESDVMDTWATSSLSPVIAAEKHGLSSIVPPYTARFQAHDIISTWAFTTILRSIIHRGEPPWKEAFISGNVKDPTGSKLSKSKGNAVSPMDFITKYGADAVRYWASGAAAGEDISISEQEFVRGRRTVIKLLNSFRLLEILSGGSQIDPVWKAVHPVNMWILAKVSGIIEEVTAFMDAYEFSKGRSSIDNFFWNIFCDNYLEIIKSMIRIGTESGNARMKNETLGTAFGVFISLIKMYAPFLPFITEEIYSLLRLNEKKKSVHLERWPVFSFRGDSALMSDVDCMIEVIGSIRALKSGLKISMSAGIPAIKLVLPDCGFEQLSPIVCDMLRVGRIDIENGEKIEASLLTG
ncbi:MAG: valine--tRNA ligase [Candidatus Thermoplasmatota archaeon]|jgi:valyl-tRNA synthetase|nr:valine--tRNA ligase [Candidatus Thermoplasmatota archaeon]MCL5793253.1 valine--tRNA ligase [Candidatus Thermoplasmatota archaeon]